LNQFQPHFPMYHRKFYNFMRANDLMTYMRHLYVFIMYIFLKYWLYYGRMYIMYKSYVFFVKVFPYIKLMIITEMLKYKNKLFISFEKLLLLYVFVLSIYKCHGFMLYMVLFYCIACVFVRKHSLQFLLFSMSFV